MQGNSSVYCGALGGQGERSTPERRGAGQGVYEGGREDACRREGADAKRDWGRRGWVWLGPLKTGPHRGSTGGTSGSIQVGAEQPWRASSLSHVEALGWFGGWVGVRVGQGGPPLFQRGPVPRLASAATNFTGACVGMLAWDASFASCGSGARNGAQPAAGLAGLLCRRRCVGAAARAQGRGLGQAAALLQQLAAAAYCSSGWRRAAASDSSEPSPSFRPVSPTSALGQKGVRPAGSGWGVEEWSMRRVHRSRGR